MPNRNVENDDVRYPVTVYEVEAMEVKPEDAQQIARWCGGEVATEISKIDKTLRFSAILLPTMTGVKRALEGDFIVKWPAAGYQWMTKPEFDYLFEPAKEG